MVHKEALQDQVKVRNCEVKFNSVLPINFRNAINSHVLQIMLMQIIGGDLDGVRKEQQAVRAKIKQLDDALKAIDNDIKTLQDELTSVTEKRGRAHESIQQLRKNRDEGVCWIA